LAAHGWKVVPGGIDVCKRPGTRARDCGAGITKGAKLSFTYLVATTPPLPTQAAAEKATWSREGISVRITKGTFNTVIGRAVPCPKGCAWEMGNWGGDWVFTPDYYPTGEELFAPGAGANTGLWTTSKSNELIKKTDITTTSLTAYENYLTRAVPVIWQPVTGGTLLEIHKGLVGVTKNAFGSIPPATWSWKKR
jgi:peptide/nickel transport system substrate-binding protein